MRFIPQELDVLICGIAAIVLRSIRESVLLSNSAAQIARPNDSFEPMNMSSHLRLRGSLNAQNESLVASNLGVASKIVIKIDGEIKHCCR